MKKSAWLLFAGFLACILFLNFTSSYCSDDCIMGIGIHISGGCAPERLGTLMDVRHCEYCDDGMFSVSTACGCREEGQT